MKILGAIVLLLNFGLSLAVGVRLLGRSLAEGRWIERCLAVYFLVGLLGGGALVTAAYAGWSDPSLGLPDTWIPGLHAAGNFGIALGVVAILFFTRLTFRPESPWATGAAIVGSLALALGFAGRQGIEGFEISTDPGPLHWLMYWVRIAALVWMTTEASIYAARSRKRLKLGLIDPMVADRFWLWSIWAGASLLTALSEVIARNVYAWMGGDPGSVDGAARGLAAPIIFISLTITSVTGLISAGALFLTFFPTERYRVRVARRAERLSPSSALDS